MLSRRLYDRQNVKVKTCMNSDQHIPTKNKNCSCLDYEGAQDRIVLFQVRQVLAYNLSLLNTDQVHTKHQTNIVTDSDFFLLVNITNRGWACRHFFTSERKCEMLELLSPSSSFTFIYYFVFSSTFFHLSLSLLLILLHF